MEQMPEKKKKRKKKPKCTTTRSREYRQKLSPGTLEQKNSEAKERMRAVRAKKKGS